MVARACTMAVVLLASAAFAQILGAREYRAMETASYAASIQRNGLVNVRLRSGEVVMEGASPMVRLADDDRPQRLRLRGVQTARSPVGDRLGEGQGMSFAGRNGEWRINTYPARPFMTVQAAFTNNTDSPVRVAELYPLCIGAPERGGLLPGLTPGEPAVLASSAFFSGGNPVASLAEGDVVADAWVAFSAEPAQQAMVVGFLSDANGATRLEVRREGTGDAAFGLFRAATVFDPPVEVAPGEILQSGLLYLGVAEIDAYQALQRYAHALAIMNGVVIADSGFPKGWFQPGPGPGAQDQILAEGDRLIAGFSRYGWTHVVIPGDWGTEPGDLTPDADRYPEGMAWLARELHSRNLSAVLTMSPFTAGVTSDLAARHPDWLVPPQYLRDAAALPPGLRVLDVTQHDVRAHVANIAEKVTRDWGFDAILMPEPLVALALVDWSQLGASSPAVVRMGMNLLREAARPGTVIVAGGPMPLTGTGANAVTLQSEPSVSSAERVLSCRNQLALAAHGAAFTPYLFAPAFPPLPLGAASPDRGPMTLEQTVSSLTAAALAGGVVQVEGTLEHVHPQLRNVLQRLLPVPTTPARPVDLFESRHPRVWWLPLNTEAGRWDLVAVFNRDEHSSLEVPLHLDTIGLDPETYYTVYDFWRSAYAGVAQHMLNVTVPPGGVALLGLRAYEDRPMLVAVDNHIAQGAMTLEELAWEPGARTLRGSFPARAGVDYRLKVLVPEPFTMREVFVTRGRAETSKDSSLLTTTISCDRDGPLSWRLEF